MTRFLRVSRVTSPSQVSSQLFTCPSQVSSLYLCDLSATRVQVSDSSFHLCERERERERECARESARERASVSERERERDSAREILYSYVKRVTLQRTSVARVGVFPLTIGLFWKYSRGLRFFWATFIMYRSRPKCMWSQNEVITNTRWWFKVSSE